MRISRASTYALYGLAYIASQPAGRRVPLSEIRKVNGVPEKHLAKIFLHLVRAGILSSARGVKGGFQLSCKPREVSLLRVVELIDGPARVDGCLVSRLPCHDTGECALHRIWRRAQGRMLSELGRATLADVANGLPTRRHTRRVVRSGR